MCVVSVAWNAHPRWKLVVAGNRDEFHARDAAPLVAWAENSSIIAGRDMLSQGTWMGVSRHGRFGVVTNIRDPQGPDPQKASRGALVTDWLAKGQMPETIDRFNPFNLLMGDQHGLYFLSNRPADLRYSLESGIHGLSNAIKGERWPRKERLNLAVASWLDGAADDPMMLFDCLADTQSDHDDAHPVFIRNSVYGTRCSTILAVERDGTGSLVERRFDGEGTYTGETSVTFHWFM
ncbi:MAG: NRDE family protein [Pseudomonadota bacterium]